MIAAVKYVEKTLGTWDTYNTKYQKKSHAAIQWKILLVFIQFNT